jgi:hypothetical protein
MQLCKDAAVTPLGALHAAESNTRIPNPVQYLLHYRMLKPQTCHVYGPGAAQLIPATRSPYVLAKVIWSTPNLKHIACIAMSAQLWLEACFVVKSSTLGAWRVLLVRQCLRLPAVGFAQLNRVWSASTIALPQLNHKKKIIDIVSELYPDAQNSTPNPHAK